MGERDDQDGFDLRSANPRADDGVESGGKCRALFRKRKAGARKGLDLIIQNSASSGSVLSAIIKATMMSALS